MGGARIVRLVAAAAGLGPRADRFAGPPRTGFSPIALGGCGRSGTTLLRMMLDSHPRIFCGPESSVFRRRALDAEALADRFGLPRRELHTLDQTARSRPEFIEAFAGLCLRQAGKARWAEKTPRNISRVAAIFRYFPEARFVHVLRDGRDVACSLRTHPRHRVVDGRLLPTGNWKPIAPCARRWRDDIECSRPWWGDPRFHTLRYEELVREPRPVLARLMEFLGEPWDDALLEHAGAGRRDVTRFAQSPEAAGGVHTASIGRWQRDLDARDRRSFKRIAGRLLIELGYAEDDGW